MNDKVPYICGPLTELPDYEKNQVKGFYEMIADVCEEITGKRAFVPHEHYDPLKHADFSPKQVDDAERCQVQENTSYLIVIAIAPSWGGGIEVEMANQVNIPVILLCPKEKFKQGKISRLLRGNPAVTAIILYKNYSSALSQLRPKLRRILEKEKAEV